MTGTTDSTFDYIERMDFAIAVAIFFALMILPAFWRSRKNSKRRIAERIVLFAFLAWALFALRACVQ